MKSVIICCLLTISTYAQSNLDKIIKSGEILVSGLAVFKERNNADTNTTIGKVCVTNKLTDKITLNLYEPDADITTKSLVVPAQGKECFLELPKGIYTYEIVLSDKEIFKRGEYRFEQSMTITIKQ